MPEPGPEIIPSSEPSEAIPTVTGLPEEPHESDVLPLEEESETPPAEETQTVSPAPEPEAKAAPAEEHSRVIGAVRLVAEHDSPCL